MEIMSVSVFEVEVVEVSGIASTAKYCSKNLTEPLNTGNAAFSAVIFCYINVTCLRVMIITLLCCYMS